MNDPLTQGPILDLPVRRRVEMAGEGFEPSKAEPTRLQRVPFDRSGTPPGVGVKFRTACVLRVGTCRSGAARAHPGAPPQDASRSC